MLESVAQQFETRTVARLGKGAAGEMASIRLAVERQVTRQILGALVLSGLENLAYDVVRSVAPTASPPTKDAKSILTEQREYSVTYHQRSLTGPQHKQVFEYEVRADDGRAAVGEGRTKSQAMKAAAAAFLARYPTSSSADDSTRAMDRAPSSPPSRVTTPEHRASVAHLLSVFSLPGSDAPMVSRSLVHQSWAAENSPPRDEPYGSFQALATLGSAVMNLAYRVTVARRVAGEITASTAALKGVSDVEAEELAQALNLGPGILLGRGQSRDGLNRKILATAAQAVLAAAFQSHGPPVVLEPPAILQTWVDRAVSRSIRGQIKGDHRTFVEGYLTGQDLTIEFDLEQGGPEHDQTFVATATVSSRHGEVIAVRGDPTSDKRSAKESAARKFRGYVLALHRPWTPELRRGVETRPALRQVLRSLARSELASLPKLRATVAVRRETAGLGHLSRSDLVGAAQVLEQYAQLAGEGSATVSRALGRLSAQLGRDAVNPFRVALAGLPGVVADLTVSEPSETWESVGAIVLELAAVSRLAAADSSVPVSQSVEEWSMLHPLEAHPVVANLDDADPAFADGAVSQLLGLLTGPTPSPDRRIGVTATSTQLVVEVPLGGAERARMTQQQAILWWYLDALFGGIQESRSSGELTVHAGPRSASALTRAALTAYRDGLVSGFPPASRTARILHDLKNQVAAARVAMAHDPSAKAVVHHLAEARRLALEVRKAAGIAEQVVEEVDLSALCRDFVSRRGESAGEELVALGTDRPLVVFTSRQAVESIIENLVSNALYATPVGGTVCVDWSRIGPAVEVAVLDEGPGLPPEVCTALDHQRPAPSLRPGGSGLGLWTAQQMARQIDARLSYRTSGAGTEWRLVVPDVDRPESSQ